MRKLQRWEGLISSWVSLGASWEGFKDSWEGLRASWKGLRNSSKGLRSQNQLGRPWTQLGGLQIQLLPHDEKWKKIPCGGSIGNCPLRSTWPLPKTKTEPTWLAEFR